MHTLFSIHTLIFSKIVCTTNVAPPLHTHAMLLLLFSDGVLAGNVEDMREIEEGYHYR